MAADLKWVTLTSSAEYVDSLASRAFDSSCQGEDFYSNPSGCRFEVLDQPDLSSAKRFDSDTFPCTLDPTCQGVFGFAFRSSGRRFEIVGHVNPSRAEYLGKMIHEQFIPDVRVISGLYPDPVTADLKS